MTSVLYVKMRKMLKVRQEVSINYFVMSLSWCKGAIALTKSFIKDCRNE